MQWSIVRNLLESKNKRGAAKNPQHREKHQNQPLKDESQMVEFNCNTAMDISDIYPGCHMWGGRSCQCMPSHTKLPTGWRSWHDPRWKKTKNTDIGTNFSAAFLLWAYLLWRPSTAQWMPRRCLQSADKDMPLFNLAKHIGKSHSSYVMQLNIF